MGVQRNTSYDVTTLFWKTTTPFNYRYSTGYSKTTGGVPRAASDLGGDASGAASRRPPVPVRPAPALRHAGVLRRQRRGLFLVVAVAVLRRRRNRQRELAARRPRQRPLVAVGVGSGRTLRGQLKRGRRGWIDNVITNARPRNVIHAA